MKSKIKSRMKKALFLGLLIVFTAFAAGCSTMPVNKAEMVPLNQWNQDSRVGLIIVEGQPSINVWLRDETGRTIEFWTEKGSSPSMTFNNRTPIRIYVHQVPAIGNYQVLVESFYYKTLFFPPGVRYPVRLQPQNYYITVGRNPVACQDYEFTKTWWGWILRINTGFIPLEDTGMPTVNIQGTGFIKDIVDGLGRRSYR